MDCFCARFKREIKYLWEKSNVVTNGCSKTLLELLPASSDIIRKGFVLTNFSARDNTINLQKSQYPACTFSQIILKMRYHVEDGKDEVCCSKKDFAFQYHDYAKLSKTIAYYCFLQTSKI